MRECVRVFVHRVRCSSALVLVCDSLPSADSRRKFVCERESECMCDRERESEREREKVCVVCRGRWCCCATVCPALTAGGILCVHMCMYACV